MMLFDQEQNFHLIQSLSDQTRQQKRHIAKLEYHNLMKELQTDAFLYQTRKAKKVPRKFGVLDSLLGQNSIERGPPLSVPLGSIAWSERENELPIIGILIEQQKPKQLSQQLIPLFAEHHRRPFCRFLFLCQRLDILPFLGRYNFAYFHNHRDWETSDYDQLKLRFSMTEIRSVAGTKIS